jgi:hypothetical protein
MGYAKTFVAGLIFLILTSCYRPGAKESMQDLEHLNGKWSSSQGILFNEYWQIKSDTLLLGLGYSLQDNDTVFKEELKIFYLDAHVFYGAKVGDTDQFVLFKLVKAGKNNWIFENHEHDYPNIINYEIDKGRLVASTANSNGNKKIEFIMKRIPQ